MAIHHATLKSAAAEGIQLTQDGLKVVAFSAKHGNTLTWAGKARDALNQMLDLVWLREYCDNEGLTYEVVPEGEASDTDCSAITLKVGSWDASGTPAEVRTAFRDRAAAASTVEMETPEEAADALDVDVEDLEQAETEEEERLSGSVVDERYRATYAERGNPNHCGDAMAVWFDTHCANKAGTDIELFEAICSLNGVDLSKYNRTTRGWQGRLRMTGRNMLARRVYAAGGTMVVPETMGGTVKFDAEWMASRKFAQPKAAK
jgi:hypothetical protein